MRLKKVLMFFISLLFFFVYVQGLWYISGGLLLIVGGLFYIIRYKKTSTKSLQISFYNYFSIPPFFIAGIIVGWTYFITAGHHLKYDLYQYNLERMVIFLLINLVSILIIVHSDGNRTGILSKFDSIKRSFYLLFKLMVLSFMVGVLFLEAFGKDTGKTYLQKVYETNIYRKDAVQGEYFIDRDDGKVTNINKLQLPNVKNKNFAILPLTSSLRIKIPVSILKSIIVKRHMLDFGKDQIYINKNKKIEVILKFYITEDCYVGKKELYKIEDFLISWPSSLILLLRPIAPDFFLFHFFILSIGSLMAIFYGVVIKFFGAYFPLKK